MNKNILKLRIVLWLALLWVVAGFLYMGIVPSGAISYKYDFNKKSSFVGELGPSTRVKTTSKEYPNIIIGNPAYITLASPRKFNEVIFKMRYRRINERVSEEQYPVIEAGILVDNTVWRYDLKPLENEIIDKLALVWDIQRSGDLLLLQQNDNMASSTNRIYDGVESFLEDLPDDNKIALYNYDLKRDFTLVNYRSFFIEEMLDDKEARQTIIEQDLRGNYQFYTYIKNEELDFVFTFVDLNQNRDRDDIDIFFYYENHLIASSHLDDDGITEDGGNESGKRELELKLPDLPEGVYKIELKVNNDIVTKQIKSKQRKIAFINRVWLEKDDSEGGLSLFTNSSVIQMNTTYADRLQIIMVGTKKMELLETYKQYSTKVEKRNGLDDFSEIKLENDGVVLSGNRVFSFSPDTFFDPNIKKLDKYIDIAGDGIRYVLARYKEPAVNDGWKNIEVAFDLAGVYREDGRYSFLISVPGLSSPALAEEENFGVEIDEVEFEFKGRSLSEKLKEFFGKN